MRKYTEDEKFMKEYLKIVAQIILCKSGETCGTCRTCKLIAEENMKITKNRDIFMDVVYLGINENISDWEEVGYDIWKYFIKDEVPQNKVEELEKQISSLQEDKENLEFVLLNTDFRLTCMELKDEGILE